MCVGSPDMQTAVELPKWSRPVVTARNREVSAWSQYAADELRLSDGKPIRGTGHALLVVVLLMREGKSLLFVVPACLEEPGVTLVVVLFGALLGIMAKCMKVVDIERIEWKAGEANVLAAAVVVSVDRAAEWDFMDDASRLH